MIISVENSIDLKLVHINLGQDLKQKIWAELLSEE